LITEDDRFKIPAGEVALPVQANAAEQAAKRAARRERRHQKR
jgi:hypothetical protein